MPSTQPYVPTWDFDDDPAPANLVNAGELQTQLDLISANQTDLIAALGVTIRDDDTLEDEVVYLRNLHPEVSTLLAQVSEGAAQTAVFTFKYPADVATTANITLSGEQTIDGILTAASRVLVKDQTDQAENGIYTSDAGAWVRTADLDTDDDAGSGWAIIVRDGDTNGLTTWAILNGGDTALTVGTDDIEFYAVVGAVAHPAKRYTTTLTFDGSNTDLTRVVNHNLGNAVCGLSIQAGSTGTPVIVGVQAVRTSENAITLTFPNQTGAASVEVAAVG